MDLDLIDKYLGEAIGLNNKQIIQTYGKEILKYYSDRTHQFRGSSEIDALSVVILDILKKHKEKNEHLSDKDLKEIAKALKQD